MMDLYVVTHKHSEYLPKGRKFIGVGKNKSIENVKVYDNTLNNICMKNESYCELTALYWIWKNTNQEVCGLEHYRRFFCKKTSFFRAKPINERKIKMILKKNDLIVSTQFKFKPNIYEYYCKNHIRDDLEKCEKILLELYPEYEDAYLKIMHGDKTFMCNMFIGKKSIINDYCKWLFSIFSRLDTIIELGDRDSYQKRVFGFLSERLFNVWVEKNNIKVYHCPIYMPNDIPIVIKLKSLCSKLCKK